MEFPSAYLGEEFADLWATAVISHGGAQRARVQQVRTGATSLLPLVKSAVNEANKRLPEALKAGTKQHTYTRTFPSNPITTRDQGNISPIQTRGAKCSTHLGRCNA